MHEETFRTLTIRLQVATLIATLVGGGFVWFKFTKENDRIAQQETIQKRVEYCASVSDVAGALVASGMPGGTEDRRPELFLEYRRLVNSGGTFVLRTTTTQAMAEFGARFGDNGRALDADMNPAAGKLIALQRALGEEMRRGDF
jgi:hypothetical protein